MKRCLAKFVPSFFSGLNLYFGLLAIVSLIYFDYEKAIISVCIGIFFDFFDGFSARKLGVASDFGKQLDSLADVITSGIVPGMVMYTMFQEYTPTNLIFLSGLIPLFAAVRLAKFNVDTRQSVHFLGLNTPTNTLFIISLPFVKETFGILNTPLELAIVCVVSSFLMNAPIYLFSLKLKKKDLASNWHIIIQLLFSIPILFMLNFSGLPLIILFYIGLSLMIQKKLRSENAH